MGSHSLGLGFNPLLLVDPEGAPYHENIDSQCVIQLGIVAAGDPLVLDETVTVRHETLPPLYDLSLVPDPKPDWLSSLTITATGVIIPPLPGLAVSGFTPFDPEDDPESAAVTTPVAYTLPTPPLQLTGNGFPGGFAHYSMPSSMYGLHFAGEFNPEAEAGLYRYVVYVMGRYAPVGDLAKVGKIQVCVQVQAANAFKQAASVPEGMRPPPLPEE